MVFEYKTEASFFRVPKLNPGPVNVWFSDVFTSKEGEENPLTGSMFFLDYNDVNEPPPKYTYDESGVVLHGELHLEDEAGNKARLLPGDTFFVHRGSTINFSTPRYAVAYKTAARTKQH